MCRCITFTLSRNTAHSMWQELHFPTWIFGQLESWCHCFLIHGHDGSLHILDDTAELNTENYEECILCKCWGGQTLVLSAVTDEAGFLTII